MTTAKDHGVVLKRAISDVNAQFYQHKLENEAIKMRKEAAEKRNLAFYGTLDSHATSDWEIGWGKSVRGDEGQRDLLEALPSSRRSQVQPSPYAILPLARPKRDSTEMDYIDVVGYATSRASCLRALEVYREEANASAQRVYGLALSKFYKRPLPRVEQSIHSLSIMDPNDLDDSRPTVLVLGPSNSGKSQLLDLLDFRSATGDKPLPGNALNLTSNFTCYYPQGSSCRPSLSDITTGYGVWDTPGATSDSSLPFTEWILPLMLLPCISSVRGVVLVLPLDGSGPGVGAELVLFFEFLSKVASSRGASRSGLMFNPSNTPCTLR